MNIEANTLEGAVAELSRFKQWQPHRFSGVWHLAIIGGKAKAYRSKRDLLKCAAKHGLQSIPIVTL